MSEEPIIWEIALGHTGIYQMPPRMTDDGWIVSQTRVVQFDHKGRAVSERIEDGARYRFE